MTATFSPSFTAHIAPDGTAFEASAAPPWLQAAEQAGLLFPLSLAAEGTATIGGVISTNAGGTAVIRYGVMRDLVLGIEAVMPDGEVFHGLKRLRKDNTGYDLKQLLIGAEGTLGVVTGVEMLQETAAPITLFLILRAFSSGSTALNGIEAISNGITAFKEPRSRNAARTLVVMSSLLVVLFLGITILSRHIQAIPSHHETIISQMARTIYGAGSIPYLLLIAGTALVLLMAANTWARWRSASALCPASSSTRASTSRACGVSSTPMLASR